jgi:hypothetical protein
VAQGVVFRGLPQKLSPSWGMCDGFTSPSRLDLADGSVLVTFPLVFEVCVCARARVSHCSFSRSSPPKELTSPRGEQGEKAPMGCGDAGNNKCGRPSNHSAIVNHLPMSLVVFKSVDHGFTFDFLSVAANWSQIPGNLDPQAAFKLSTSAYGPQENGMALLRDNTTIMIAFRPDTDSMCPGIPLSNLPVMSFGSLEPEMTGKPAHADRWADPLQVLLPGLFDGRWAAFLTADANSRGRLRAAENAATARLLRAVDDRRQTVPYPRPQHNLCWAR